MFSYYFSAFHDAQTHQIDILLTLASAYKNAQTKGTYILCSALYIATSSS